MPFLSARFENALVYANSIHAGQIRKGSSIPYMSHLMSVSALVLEYGGDEDQAIAGLLHDAVEDCGGKPRLENIRIRFGGEVATIVDHCTDSWEEPKPPWKNRKDAYLKGLPKKPERSLLVSLADKTHNAGAILADCHAVGEEIWDRFTASKEETLWYYRSLEKTFDTAVQEPRARHLSRRLTRMVDEMHQLANQ